MCVFYAADITFVIAYIPRLVSISLTIIVIKIKTILSMVNTLKIIYNN